MLGSRALVLHHTVENSQKRTGIGPHPQAENPNLFKGFTPNVRRCGHRRRLRRLHGPRLRQSRPGPIAHFGPDSGSSTDMHPFSLLSIYYAAIDKYAPRQVDCADWGLWIGHQHRIQAGQHLQLSAGGTLDSIAILAISASGNDGGAIEVPNIITARSRLNILAQALR